MIARSLGAGHGVAVASPAYIKTHGEPQVPAELEGHECILFGAGRRGRSWEFEAGGKTQQVAVRARLLVNDVEVMREAKGRLFGV